MPTTSPTYVLLHQPTPPYTKHSPPPPSSPSLSSHAAHTPPSLHAPPTTLHGHRNNLLLLLNHHLPINKPHSSNPTSPLHPPRLKQSQIQRGIILPDRRRRFAQQLPPPHRKRAQ